MAHSSERIVFVPGYGEGVEESRMLADHLSRAIDEEVTPIDLYDRTDTRFYPHGMLPSLELAYRAGHQLGFDGVPKDVLPISHSRGARVATHFEAKPDEVMLAPEGLEPGKAILAANFTKDLFARIVTGPAGDRRFARHQFGHIMHNPVEAFRQAHEMVGTPGQFDHDARALVVGYANDQVIPEQRIGIWVNEMMPHVQYEWLPGGHYEPFRNPTPTARVVAEYLRSRAA